jgi:hypothetical protein
MSSMDVGAPAHRSGSETRPAAIAHGPGHLVVYGNPAFRSAFGEVAVGLPARESMLDLPPDAFTLLDAVYAEGRPFARWVRRGGATWRLTAIPRRDAETGEVFGVAFHLRARDDLPIRRPEVEPAAQDLD